MTPRFSLLFSRLLFSLSPPSDSSTALLATIVIVVISPLTAAIAVRFPDRPSPHPLQSGRCRVVVFGGYSAVSWPEPPKAS
ncbi:MAG: hypothetical protein P4L81_02630, partial [Candidatus Pacebacteria bacterium]|nr:hypothetical protein [Candidatus Paceibacterota bacterium]